MGSGLQYFKVEKNIYYLILINRGLLTSLDFNDT